MPCKILQSPLCFRTLAFLPVLLCAPAFAQVTLPLPTPFRCARPSGTIRPRELRTDLDIDPLKRMEAPLRPVVDEEALTDPEYELMKDLTAEDPQPRPDSGPGGILPDSSLFYVLAGLNGTNTGWNPPDCTLAVGPNSVVEAANGVVQIYTRGAGRLQVSNTLDMQTFMNWTHSSPYDCRALYDPSGHFIVSYDSRAYKDANGVTHQNFLLAVSQTDDATGAWWTYNFDTIPITSDNPNFVKGDIPLFDFPDIGLDAGNLYITANVFGNKAYYGATLIALDKVALERGGTLYGFHDNGLNSTLTPPFVRSNQSGFSYMVFPQEFSSKVGVYAWSGAVSSGKVSLSGPYSITVPYYAPPPAAVQPGSVLLDTLDGRFQDKTTQVGDTVYAVHAVDDHGFPDVRAYQLDALHDKMAQVTTLYATATSCDFNPSIAANDQGTVVVNWNYTDSNRTRSVFESIRAVVLGPTKSWPAHLSGVSIPTATSAVSLTTFRNGDYSMTVVDPLSQNVFWGINQAALSPDLWNTFLFSYQTP